MSARCCPRSKSARSILSPNTASRKPTLRPAKRRRKAARRARSFRARRSKPLRNIWLCADDYGLSPSVNAGIRELIARGRLNATSVMVAAPHLGDDEAPELGALNAHEKRAAIGLHVTLTAPFKPMSSGFAPLRDGNF